MSDEDAQEHFDDFFEDVFVELEDKYGEIEEMNVCDNLGDHLVGNVYVKVRYDYEQQLAFSNHNTIPVPSWRRRRACSERFK